MSFFEIGDMVVDSVAESFGIVLSNTVSISTDTFTSGDKFELDDLSYWDKIIEPPSPEVIK